MIFLEHSEAKRIGFPTTRHHTRICRRVTCSRCGEKDYIAKKIPHNKKALCRKCAEVYLETYELGTALPTSTYRGVCEKCRRNYILLLSTDVEKAALERKECGDCRRGYLAWQGSLQNTSSEKGLREKRVGGIVLRKKPIPRS